MMQIVEMTHEQKVAMYMKLSKHEIAEMLVNSNNLNDALCKQLNAPIITYSDVCEHDYPMVWHGTTPPICGKCGKPAPGFWTTSSYSTTTKCQ